MMALAKCVIKDLSVKLLEYPEMAIPEQGLKRNYSQQFLCFLS